MVDEKADTHRVRVRLRQTGKTPGGGQKRSVAPITNRRPSTS